MHGINVQSVGNRGINCPKLHHKVIMLHCQDIVCGIKISLMVFSTDASHMCLVYARTQFHDVGCFWVTFSIKAVGFVYLVGIWMLPALQYTAVHLWSFHLLSLLHIFAELSTTITRINLQILSKVTPCLGLDFQARTHASHSSL